MAGKREETGTNLEAGTAAEVVEGDDMLDVERGTTEIVIYHTNSSRMLTGDCVAWKLGEVKGWRESYPRKTSTSVVEDN